MGIHDYSCFLCSDEGEQDLEDWTCKKVAWNPDIDDDDYDDGCDYEDRECTFPPQEGECHSSGSSKAYLYFFKKNPLEKWTCPIKRKKVSYCWDSWHFEGYEEYREVLMGDGFKEPINGEILTESIYSVWKDKKYWVLNLCPACNDYFVKDKRNDPPPELLVRILTKFNLVPFKKFKKSNILPMECDQIDSKLESLFPLPCYKLRDYIREFCYYLDLRKTDVDL